jgi:hypothetical protein
MTWPALILADSSPCLRWLVLRELFQYPEDHPEVRELASIREKDLLVQDLCAFQSPDGSWKPDMLAEGRAGGNRILSTAFALTRLGYLGFDASLPAVQRGAAYLFAQQSQDGSWPLPADFVESGEQSETPGREGYSMMPLQTAFPLRSLAACGYAADSRSEQAYEWLLAQRLADGAWPTGMASGVYGYVAGYRRLPHSRWGCRSNTTGALICLSLHPQRRVSPEARRALDLLLGRETQEETAVGYEVARLVGAERTHGFITYFARFDLALILDLCSRIGAAQSDERVSRVAAFLLNLQGPRGLWDYSQRPQAARWLTFDILRSLSRLDESRDWLSLEPKTPFQPYPKQPKRF